MKRKTNLFYSSGSNSNFVTFSNYTESLTGNILATDAKMFPSKFICLYIPRLAEATNFAEEKGTFIRDFLSAYYENKLAALRDNAISKDSQVEQKINPLLYLFDTIKKYDESYEITFIDSISEQDFNGTFMDNICIIESYSEAKTYSITCEFDSDSEVSRGLVETDNFSDSKLYGWENATSMPVGYEETKPKYDTESQIYYYDYVSAEISESTDSEDKIKFNVLIPLFDIMHYNLNDNGETTVDGENEDRSILELNSSGTNNQYDIPMGMWFSNKTIELERSQEIDGSSYRPSWSLCISSQFKPFPYSNSYPNEIDDSEDSTKFASFAMIMSKQAYIIDEFMSLRNQLEELNTKVDRIQNKVNNVQTFVVQDKYEELNAMISELKEQIEKITPAEENE